jgi:hypothetical protein
MSVRMMLLTISGALMLSALALPTSAQVTDAAAREQTRDAVRSQLHLKPDQFLGVQRDEKLEQLLATVAGRSEGLEFIYQVSQAGDEIKGNAVVHHIFTDADPTYIVAVSPADGGLYRIHGFTDSLTEFGKLMAATKVKVLSPDQAEAVADFYREVNPERRSMTQISGSLELKQAAERQCQAVPFDPSEKGFEAWWQHAKPLYSGASFKQTAARTSSGYAVEWIVLSSPGAGLCGGAALRARLEVGSDGRVGELTFVPLLGVGVSHDAGHAQNAPMP